MADDTWDPGQYRRFEAERRQPFDDLVSLVRPVPGGRVVDLGCGPGNLTAELHRRLAAACTVGVDRSPAMLAAAAAHADPAAGLTFRLGDVADAGTEEGERWDVVFANASLQWVPGHEALLPRLRAALAPGGQLAFQVPANGDHPSHTIAGEVGAEFAAAGLLDGAGGAPPADATASVLPPEVYASLLDGMGSVEQHVRLQVYGHHLASAGEVVEWVKGTLLTPYRALLSAAAYEAYLARYRELLVARLGPAEPYFYAYKRILAWARFE